MAKSIRSISEVLRHPDMVWTKIWPNTRNGTITLCIETAKPKHRELVYVEFSNLGMAETLADDIKHAVNFIRREELNR